MKKATAGLVAALLVILFYSNAWAQPGFRVDLGGNGLGFSIYSQPYGPYQPYTNYNSRPYPARPYQGWGKYRGHHPGHRHWQHHRHGHHYKGRHHQKRHGQGNRHHKNRGHNRHYGR